MDELNYRQRTPYMAFAKGLYQALVIVLAMGATTAQGQPAKSRDLCEDLMSSFEHASKAISLTWIGGLGDNSAARETNRKLGEVAWLLIQDMNLTLMIQHKCPMPRRAVGGVDYLTQALECSDARLKRPSERDHRECDPKHWRYTPR